MAPVNPVPISLAPRHGAEVVIAVNLNTDLHQPWTDEPDAPAPGGLSQGPVGENPALPGMWVMTGSINIMQERITRARMAGDPEIQRSVRALAASPSWTPHRASDAINEGRFASSATWISSGEEFLRLG